MAGKDSELRTKLNELNQNLQEMSSLLKQASEKAADEITEQLTIKKEELKGNLNEASGGLCSSAGCREDLKQTADSLKKVVTLQAEALCNNIIERVSQFGTSLLQAMADAAQQGNETLSKYSASPPPDPTSPTQDRPNDEADCQKENSENQKAYSSNKTEAQTVMWQQNCPPRPQQLACIEKQQNKNKLCCKAHAELLRSPQCPYARRGDLICSEEEIQAYRKQLIRLAHEGMQARKSEGVKTCDQNKRNSINEGTQAQPKGCEEGIQTNNPDLTAREIQTSMMYNPENDKKVSMKNQETETRQNSQINREDQKSSIREKDLTHNSSLVNEESKPVRSEEDTADNNLDNRESLESSTPQESFTSEGNTEEEDLAIKPSEANIEGESSLISEEDESDEQHSELEEASAKTSLIADENASKKSSIKQTSVSEKENRSLLNEENRPSKQSRESNKNEKSNLTNEENNASRISPNDETSEVQKKEKFSLNEENHGTKISSTKQTNENKKSSLIEEDQKSEELSLLEHKSEKMSVKDDGNQVSQDKSVKHSITANKEEKTSLSDEQSRASKQSKITDEENQRNKLTSFNRASEEETSKKDSQIGDENEVIKQSSNNQASAVDEKEKISLSDEEKQVTKPSPNKQDGKVAENNQSTTLSEKSATSSTDQPIEREFTRM